MSKRKKESAGLLMSPNWFKWYYAPRAMCLFKPENQALVLLNVVCFSQATTQAEVPPGNTVNLHKAHHVSIQKFHDNCQK